MNKTNLILPSVLAIIFTSILIIFSPSSKKTPLSSLTPTPTSTESISPTPDPTANWKSFRDDNLKIQFKYPDQYKLDITRDGNYYGVYLKGSNFRTESNDLAGVAYLGTFFVFSDSTICEAAPAPELETLISKNNNFSFYKIKGIEGPDYKVALIKKSSNGCIHFVCMSDNLCEGTELTDFQSILSTFKFTDTKSSSNPSDTRVIFTDDECLSITINKPESTKLSLVEYINKIYNLNSELPLSKTQYKINGFESITIPGMNIEEISNTYVKKSDTIIWIAVQNNIPKGPPRCKSDYSQELKNIIQNIQL